MAKRPLMRRREALKGLGVLALSSPALTAIGCGYGRAPAPAESAGGAGFTVAGVTGDAGAAAPANPTGTSGAGGTPVGPNATAATNIAGQGARQGNAAGASGTAGSALVSGTGGASGAAGGAGAAGMRAGRPMFEDAARCVLTTTDIEGPFFIDDHEVPNDESLIRSDIREGLPGVECDFYFRLLDAKNACAPIAGAEVYIWHCNADGLYSGFANQDPSKPYTGAPDRTPENLDRFCRGVQLTDADGVAAFTSVYPGWYAGRPVHVHLIARFDGASMRMITTQLYFPAMFSKEVYQTEPAYMARAAAVPAASLNPPTSNPAMPSMKHGAGLVTGTLNVIVNRT